MSELKCLKVQIAVRCEFKADSFFKVTLIPISFDSFVIAVEISADDYDS